MSTLGQA